MNPLEAKIKPIHEDIKASGIKSPQIQQIFDLVESGQALPDTPEFFQALGIGGSQHGIEPKKWGPLAPLRYMFDANVPKLQQAQAMASKIGNIALQGLVQIRQQQQLGPKTLGEAESVLPGFIKPFGAEQTQLGAPLGPNDQGPVAPFNPHAKLTPAQQGLVAGGLDSVAKGHLVAGPDGVVPASVAAYQGRSASPELAQWVAQNAMGAPGELTPPPGAVPQSLLNKIVEEQGQRNRMMVKPPDLGDRLESLAVGNGYQNARALQQADPELYKALRERAFIQEPHEITQFNQGELAKRMMATAAPIAAAQETARKEADRDQPLPDPQLWRDPVTANAATSVMTTREAQKKGYVKVRPDQVETINQLDAIDNGLEKVKEISKRILFPKKNTPLSEALRSMGQTAYLAWLRNVGNQDVMMMDSIISRLTAPLVKSQGDTANIAVAEREMFAKALVNNQASMEAVIANLDNVIDASKSVRKKMGFKVDEGQKPKPKDTKKPADTRSHKAPTKDPAARYEQLKKSGLKEDAIYKKLAEEGF